MLHQLPGRFRAKHSRLYDKKLSQYIGIYCDSLFGVKCCNANYRTATLLVVYDEEKTNAGLLLRNIEDAIALGSGDAHDGMGIFQQLQTAESRRALSRRKLIFYGLFYIALRAKQVIFGRFPFSGSLKLLQAASVVSVIGGYPPIKNAYRALLRPLPVDADKLLWASSQFFTFARGSTKGVFLLWLKELSNFVKFSADADCFRILGQSLNKTSGLAARVDGSGKALVPVAQLNVGDIIEVGSGELVPVRGVVTGGEAEVDSLYYAGHPMVRQCAAGHEVAEGMAVLDGALTVRVTGQQETAASPDTGEQDVTTYQRTKAYSCRLTAPSVGLAALNALTTRSFSGALGMMLSLSPSSANAAFATGVKNYAALLNRNRLYVRNPFVIEKLAGVKHIVFDKTGTLTSAKMQLCQTVVYDKGCSEAELLNICAACEANHYHPISSAIQSAAGTPGTVAAEESSLIPGRGISARHEGRSVLIGNRQLMLDHGVDISAGQEFFERAEASYTPVFAALDGRLAGILVLSEALRENAAALIRNLKELGNADITLVTGDSDERARRTAAELGIDSIFGGCDANDKAAVVRRLQETGPVMMVGDGVNDTLAMREADVSVSFVDSACDKVKLRSDCIIFERDIDRLPDLLTLSEKAHRCIGQSITASKGMNALFAVMALLQRIDIYGAKSYNTVNSIVSLIMNQRISLLTPGTRTGNYQK